MKFLFSLGLVAFIGIFTCRASESHLDGTVPFKKASLKFLEDFNDFNVSDSRVACCEFILSEVDTPGRRPVGIEITFAALENTFHWDKEKISLPDMEGTEAAWEKMIQDYLRYWFMYFDAVHCNDNITPLVAPTKLECDLFEAIGIVIKMGADPNGTSAAFKYVEHLWSKLLLLEGGRMYRVHIRDYDGRDPLDKGNLESFVLPDILITRYVQFLLECHLHPDIQLGEGIKLDFGEAKVSNYRFVVGRAHAAATTDVFEGLQRSTNAPRSGLTKSLALFAGSAASSQKQKEWAALIARARASDTPRHRALIAMAVVGIFVVFIIAFCMCSRKKKQNVSRFDDLDAVVTII